MTIMKSPDWCHDQVVVSENEMLVLGLVKIIVSKS